MRSASSPVAVALVGSVTLVGPSPSSRAFVRVSVERPQQLAQIVRNRFLDHASKVRPHRRCEGTRELVGTEQRSERTAHPIALLETSPCATKQGSPLEKSTRLWG